MYHHNHATSYVSLSHLLRIIDSVLPLTPTIGVAPSPFHYSFPVPNIPGQQ